MLSILSVELRVVKRAHFLLQQANGKLMKQRGSMQLPVKNGMQIVGEGTTIRASILVLFMQKVGTGRNLMQLFLLKILFIEEMKI